MAERTVTPARRSDHVDVYHGVGVTDPYRWLEDVQSEETLAWVDAQNAHARSFLDSIPGRDEIRGRLAALLRLPRVHAPIHHRSGCWLQLRSDGSGDHEVLYILDGPDDDGRVLLDPNTFSADGTRSLESYDLSPDGRLLAYSYVQSGSSWPVWKVRDVAGADDRTDEITYARFGVAWAPESSGFWYAGYDPIAPGERFEHSTTHEKLWFHRLGDPQSADDLVFERPDRPGWIFQHRVSDDLRYHVITAAEGTETRNHLLYRDLSSGDPSFGSLVAADASYQFIGNDGSTFYLLTDHGAARGRVVAVDLARPDPGDWREVVPEHDGVISAWPTGMLPGSYYHEGRVVTIESHVAVARIRVTDARTGETRLVKLPAEGGLALGKPAAASTHAYGELIGFVEPPRRIRVDIATAAGDLLSEPDEAALLDVVIDEVFVESTGGARVPLRLIRRRDVQPNGRVPAILTGYGGFNISWVPTDYGRWEVFRLLVEDGAVLAWANLRGGGEYGSEWHDAGRLRNKQNVFDDFAACARWLVDNGWSSARDIAIHGTSNGGLLVGASVVQHPELFGAAVAEVGVLDMLRYHLWTSGRWWTGDYGSSDDPQMFEVLRAYSPVHNVREGAAYPPTLVMAALNDDHVVPGHSFKFGAALQHAQAGSAPILVRTETHTGHGLGKSVTIKLDEGTDLVAFVKHATGA